jgi:trimethylamine:corrinoid methyltransferase-like protein
MKFSNHSYDVLSPSEIGLIHAGALRILNEMGIEIQNRKLLEACASANLPVDFDSQRVRFPPAYVEHFLAEVEKFDWDTANPRIDGSAGIYASLYHDPETGSLVPWTEERLAFYFALAAAQSHVNGARMLGSRIVPGPAILEPLYERYYCWKYGAHVDGSIYMDEICPYLLDLYQVYADRRGVPIQDIFKAGVFLVPPFKLGVHEAYQLVYFWERGLHVSFSDMFSMGMSAPVTLAGAVTLNLAEHFALRILEHVLYGPKQLHLGSVITAADMRTTVFPFGRPEITFTNLMTAQLARFYGATFIGFGGLTDGKMPSTEVGMQKMLTALPVIMTGGDLWTDAGLLANDEIVSPIQLLLDNEYLGLLKRFWHEFEVSEDTLAIDTILKAGPAGNFLTARHTATHYRDELWQPSIWTRTMLNAWQSAGSKLDTDTAREQIMEFKQRGAPAPVISDELDRDLLAVIERAKKAIAVK